MPEVKKFSGKYVRGKLGKLGIAMKRKSRAYLIGGCGMIFRDLKEATKDVDIVMISMKEVKEGVIALKSLGYVEVQTLSPEYERLGASTVLRNGDGFQIDIFCRQVCGNLELSEGMMKRAEFLGRFGNLEVCLVAPEDIFLFKSITDRELDLDDMRILAQRGLNWDVVKAECASQSRRKAWEAFLAIRLEEMKEKYGIEAPIYKELVKSSEDELIMREFKNIMDKGNNTVEKIAPVMKEKLGYSESWTRKMLRKLVKKGLIRVEMDGRKKRYIFR